MERSAVHAQSHLDTNAAGAHDKCARSPTSMSTPLRRMGMATESAGRTSTFPQCLRVAHTQQEPKRRRHQQEQEQRPVAWKSLRSSAGAHAAVAG